MKKLVTMLLTIAMIFTIVIPAFAAEQEPAAGDLTSKQVKAMTPMNFKAVSYSYTKIRTSWDRIEDLDGYKVYRATAKNGKYTLARTITRANTVSYINTGRMTGKTYYYKMRGYKKIGKTTCYTKYSPVKSAKAQLSKPIVAVTLGGTDKSPYTRTPKSSWKAVSGATGYEVYRSREGKNRYKKIATTKKTYFTDHTGAGFKSYYNYQYKIRAYRMVNGKKVYSIFSAAKKYVPEWTMEELMPELIAYGESIEGKRLQYNPMTEAFELYTGIRNPIYHFDHEIGSIEDKNTDTGYRPVEWGDKEAMNNPTFKLGTPENSSWSAIWPLYLSPYESKQTVLKELKSAIRAEIESEMEANPLSWDIGDPDTDDWDYGTYWFTLYYRHANRGLENKSGYHFYLLY